MPQMGPADPRRVSPALVALFAFWTTFTAHPGAVRAQVADCTGEVAGTPCEGDGNVCTFEECDDFEQCVFVQSAPATQRCELDGDLCTNDFCDGAGSCADQVPVVCSPPGGECFSTAVCNPTSGLCDPVPASAGTLCADTDGDVCTAAACDGAGSCDQMHPAPAGRPCEADGNFCTLDACDGAGGCVFNRNASCPAPSNPCDGGTQCNPGTGLCSIDRPDAPAGQPCDTDGDVCTEETCDGAGQCMLDATTVCPACRGCDGAGGCVDELMTGCAVPVLAGKSLLIIKDKETDGLDAVIWKWLRGEATDAADFGDPTSADDYTLCVYDRTDLSPALVLSRTAPFDRMCPGPRGGETPCWRGIGTPPGSKGYQFKDKNRTPDGINIVVLRPGADGKARAVVRGKGPNLGLVSPLDLEPPVTVQLRAGNGKCWETTFTAAGVVANGDSLFRAKGP